MDSRLSAQFGKKKHLTIKVSFPNCWMKRLCPLKSSIHRVRWQWHLLSLKISLSRINTIRRSKNCKIILINSLRKEKVLLIKWPIINSRQWLTSIKKKRWKKVSKSMRLNQPITSTNLKSSPAFLSIKISTSLSITVFKWKRTLNGKLETRYIAMDKKLK